MTDLLLNPPITLSVVNHFVGRETMLQQSTCEGKIESVEQIVGRDKWFLISMPDLNTIRTFMKNESSKIEYLTLLRHLLLTCELRLLLNCLKLLLMGYEEFVDCGFASRDKGVMVSTEIPHFTFIMVHFGDALKPTYLAGYGYVYSPSFSSHEYTGTFSACNLPAFKRTYLLANIFCFIFFMADSAISYVKLFIILLIHSNLLVIKVLITNVNITKLIQKSNNNDKKKTSCELRIETKIICLGENHGY